MNMVLAGAVEHPKQWEFCGYSEIQNPKKRKGIIDFDRLMDLLGFENYDDLTPIKHIYRKNQRIFRVGLANHLILLMPKFLFADDARKTWCGKYL